MLLYFAFHIDQLSCLKAIGPFTFSLETRSSSAFSIHWDVVHQMDDCHTKHIKNTVDGVIAMPPIKVIVLSVIWTSECREYGLWKL